MARPSSEYIHDRPESQTLSLRIYYHELTPFPSVEHLWSRLEMFMLCTWSEMVRRLPFSIKIERISPMGSRG